jgi:hypothetical protein
MTLDLTCPDAHSSGFNWVSPVLAAMSLFMGGLGLAQAASGGAAALPVAQAASAVPTDIHSRPVFGPLSAGQLSQIQSLGRSVLVAKHSQLPSAQEQALVSELHALSNELDQAIQPNDDNAALSISDVESRTPKALAQSAAASAPLARGEALRNSLQSHVTRLHQHRVSLVSSDAGIPQEPEAREAHLDRMRHLNARAAEIEQSVQSAMALPDAERHLKIVELSQQLKPRSQEEWGLERRRALAEAHPENAASVAAQGPDRATPTLTTLVAHRPGPTSQAPKGNSAPSAAQEVSRPAVNVRPIKKH